MTNELDLTTAEWKVMECLWERSPLTGREVSEALAASAGWTRSTALTMLRRMTEKGLIACSDENGVREYAPLIIRSDAVQRETESFLDRVYSGSVSMMVSAMTKKQTLPQSEIDELYALLSSMEGGK